MDRELGHVCTEIDIGAKTQARLIECGITTIGHLVNIDDVPGLRSTTKRDLTLAAEWRARHPGADLASAFNAEVFYKFCEETEMNEALAKQYAVVLGEPYSDQGAALHDDMNKIALQMAIESCIERCKSKYLLERLGGSCFPSDQFLRKILYHLHHGLAGADKMLEKLFIVAGRTQAGKTAVIGLLQSLCAVLRIPLIVVTKGVAESIDLHSKLLEYTQGTEMEREHVQVATNKAGGHSRKVHDLLIERCFEGGKHGGCLVIADSIAQACKAMKCLEKYQQNGGQGRRKFMLLIDESDAMRRTQSKTQAFERTLQRLESLGPCLTTMISATPLVNMLEIVTDGLNSSGRWEDTDVEFFNLDPLEDYNGLNELQSLVGDDEKKIFLEQNELTSKSEFAGIPWMNEKAIALYDHALDASASKKGILVLDCSCPRVDAPNNTTDKAEGVQRYYTDRGKDIVVVTIAGKGIKVRFSVGGEWLHQPKGHTIGMVLEAIDHDERGGLKTPVAVFGYTKMRRGISFRSSGRVPTHMLMNHGRGHNLSTVLQTLGRATFNGRSLLKANGIENVTILTTYNDFRACDKLMTFIDAVATRAKEDGISFKDAFAGEVTKPHTHEADFLQATSREVCSYRGCGSLLESIWHVEEPPLELSVEEEEIKNALHNDENAQLVLRAIERLDKRNPQIAIEDIADDLNSLEERKLPKALLKRVLSNLVDKCILKKEKDGTGGRKQWFRVTVGARLQLYINSELTAANVSFEDVSATKKSSETSSETDTETTSANPYPNSDLTVKKCSTNTKSSSASPLASVALRSSPRVAGRRKSPPIYVRVKRGSGSASNPIELDSSDDESDGGEEGSISSVSLSFCQSVRQTRNASPCTASCGTPVAQTARHVVNERSKAYGPTRKLARKSSGKLQSNARKRLMSGELRQHFALPSSSPLGCEIDIHLEGSEMGDMKDKLQRGSCVTQPEKKRRIYYSLVKDSTSTIAKKFKLDVDIVLDINRQRPGFESMTKNSRFGHNSPILLPLSEHP